MFIPSKNTTITSVVDKGISLIHGDMFRLYNSHNQANVEHRLGIYNVPTIWDPIWFT
jgi:hypothetical protein